MLAAEKSKDTFIAPIGIGLALFSCEIAGVYYTGGSLNPARSFGPCVAGAHFQGYHWIYWVGPALGALLAGGYFHFVKFFNYEEANPGQDSSGGDFAERKTQKQQREMEEQQRQQRAQQDGGEAGMGAQQDGGPNGYHPGYASRQV